MAITASVSSRNSSTRAISDVAYPTAPRASTTSGTVAARSRSMPPFEPANLPDEDDHGGDADDGRDGHDCGHEDDDIDRSHLRTLPPPASEVVLRPSPGRRPSAVQALSGRRSGAAGRPRRARPVGSKNNDFIFIKSIPATLFRIGLHWHSVGDNCEKSLYIEEQWPIFGPRIGKLLATGAAAGSLVAAGAGVAIAGSGVAGAASKGPSTLPVSSFTNNFAVMSISRRWRQPGKGKVAAILPDTVSSTRYVEFDAPDITRALKAAGLTTSQIIVQNALGSDATQLTDAQTDITNGATVLMVDPIDSGVGSRSRATPSRTGSTSSTTTG